MGEHCVIGRVLKGITYVQGLYTLNIPYWKRRDWLSAYSG
jgi:hypothetical protein